eukprot:TRINITY_DN860_c0_g1_i1.p1 TRINITY_DN860_c0_g1~~TRINITY_DN860_c0_g1_i1.p1  ORF type:complete len:441 (-),score=191.55 TRINITY_DN860_c0_g1_i1:99-1373(-)
MATTQINSNSGEWSQRAQTLYSKLEKFMNEEIYVLEKEYEEYSKDQSQKWKVWQKIELLKQKAKQQQLWNLFIAREFDKLQIYGAGLSNFEYAHFAELMGTCPWSSEIFNCSAPDTGNMEVLMRYGTEQQKRDWLEPLLAGTIRSCFAMTEPEVASSDATNLISSIDHYDQNNYIINGRKWWTSGACDPRCQLSIFLGKQISSSPSQQQSRHQQHSMILIPMKTPGVTILRHLNVFGYDDSPHGHAEVIFKDVIVPKSNLLLGEGRGFEIAQGRLGPGRIHHCMRLIGMAQRCLELMIKRAIEREAFAKRLIRQGVVIEAISDSRCEIEQARLLTLKAANEIDVRGPKEARELIAMIKIVAPNVAVRVIDRAIQIHGGAGVSDDFPLARFYSIARTLRIADGPDEVHRMTVARIQAQKNISSKL